VNESRDGEQVAGSPKKTTRRNRPGVQKKNVRTVLRGENVKTSTGPKTSQKAPGLQKRERKKNLLTHHGKDARSHFKTELRGLGHCSKVYRAKQKTEVGMTLPYMPWTSGSGLTSEGARARRETTGSCGVKAKFLPQGGLKMSQWVTLIGSAPQPRKG